MSSRSELIRTRIAVGVLRRQQTSFPLSGPTAECDLSHRRFASAIRAFTIAQRPASKDDSEARSYRDPSTAIGVSTTNCPRIIGTCAGTLHEKSYTPGVRATYVVSTFPCGGSFTKKSDITNE